MATPTSEAGVSSLALSQESRRHCDFITELDNIQCTFLSEKIFLELSSTSLAVCSSVSTKWSDLIESSEVWKKKLRRKIQTRKKWKALLEIFPEVQDFLHLSDFNDFSLLYMALKKNLQHSLHTWHSGDGDDFGWERNVVPSGTRRGIYCLQFDSQKILVGKRDNSIQVLDRRTLAPLRKFEGHTGSVLCLQYDSRMIISGSSDATVRVWDLETGDILNTLRYHSDSVLDLKFALGYLVTSSRDGTIATWKLKSSTDISLIHRSIAGGGAVNAIDFDGQYIVSGGGDGIIRIWETFSGLYVKNLSGHNGGVACLQYKDNFIVSGSSDLTVRIWKVEEGTCVRVLAGHPDLVRCVQFDDRYIVSGSYDGLLIIWNFKAAIEAATAWNAFGFRLHTLYAHVGRICDIQLDEFHIVSCADDNTVIVLNSLGSSNPRLFS